MPAQTSCRPRQVAGPTGTEPGDQAVRHGRLRIRNTECVVHSEYPAARPCAWPLVRWLIIGVVLAGVFAMHVLGEHDSGGGHGMLVESHDMPAAVSSPIDSHAGIVSIAAESGSQALLAVMPVAALTPGTATQASMDTCILFLVIVGGLVLLMLLASGRPKDLVGPSRQGLPWWTLWRRGPPGSGPPRISLCVLRV